MVTAGGVENVTSAARVVPALLEATRLKWYVTPAVRPDTAALTACAPVPDPALCDGVKAPYPVEVPYSKCQVVERPLGSTVPVSVAVVVPMLVAAFVWARGGPT